MVTRVNRHHHGIRLPLTQLASGCPHGRLPKASAVTGVNCQARLWSVRGVFVGERFEGLGHVGMFPTFEHTAAVARRPSSSFSAGRRMKKMLSGRVSAGFLDGIHWTSLSHVSTCSFPPQQSRIHRKKCSPSGPLGSAPQWERPAPSESP